jgi:hypothetical protein
VHMQLCLPQTVADDKAVKWASIVSKI